MTLIADLEADGLFHEATKIHVISIACPDKGTLESYYGDRLMEGLIRVSEAPKVVWHNGIGYDVPLIEKLYNIKPKGSVHDTYVLSQILFPNERDGKAGRNHGLASWGRDFGVPKPVHEDWSQFSDAMRIRCEEDVKITSKLWAQINKTIKKEGYDISLLSKAIQFEYDLYNLFKDSFNRGWELDVVKAERLRDRLEKCAGILERKIREYLPRHIETKTYKGGLYKQDGTFKRAVEQTLNLNDGWDIKDDNTLERKVLVNLKSPVQFPQALLSVGWKPDTFTYKKDKQGKDAKDSNGDKIIKGPSISGSSFLGLPDELGNMIKRYSKYNHRKGFVQGLLDNCHEGRVIFSANTTGAATTRWKHKVIANVPGNDAFVGWHIRSLLTCPEDCVLVGCDFSQLEARVAGAITYDYDGGDYANFLLNTDIHEFNAKIFNCDRKEAKRIGYAIEYGGAAGKVDYYLGCGMKQAQQYIRNYWEARPAAAQLKLDLEEDLTARGFDIKNLWGSRAWIPALDGRPLFVRSKHSLWNTKIQSTGSIIAKRACLILNDKLKQNNLDAIIIMAYHDEMVTICKEEDKELVSLLNQESMREAGEFYGFKIEFASEAKIGKTWAEVH